MNSPRIECDISFVFALREEMDSADILSTSPDREPVKMDNLEVYKHSITDKRGNRLRCSTLVFDDQGPEIAAIKCTKYFQYVHPKLLVLLGISGRMDSDVRLGDVVLATSCDNSIYRAKLQQGTVKPGGREYLTDVLARSLIPELNSTPPFYSLDGLESGHLQQLLEASLVGDPPSTHHGAISTSPFLVDDPNYQKWLESCRNRNILATDMESSSVVQAAHECGIRNGRVLVIRGVSDPADGEKKKIDGICKGVIRKIALRNAEQLAVHSIRNFIEFHGPEPIVSSGVVGTDDYSAAFRAYEEAIALLEKISSQVHKDEKFIPNLIKMSNEASASNTMLRRQMRNLSSKCYEMVIERKTDPINSLLNELGPSSRDYLIANHIISSLTTGIVNQSTFGVLSNVYPHNVNRFVKSMLALIIDEKAFVDTLEGAYTGKRTGSKRKRNTLNVAAKAYVCYLIGRLCTAQQRQRGILLLCDWRAKLLGISQRGVTSRKLKFDLADSFSRRQSTQERLLLRSISISLLLLECPGENERYIRACIRNREFDSFNRGFHLEYYGDIDYDPRELMNNADIIQIPIDKTFRILTTKLNDSLSASAPYPTRDVDLQTLLSLCQQRHSAGALQDEYREQILRILNEYSSSSLTKFRLLQEYCGMLKEHLSQASFSRLSLVKQIYGLKKLHRTGWTDSDEVKTRANPDPESVLSHTTGGLILIEMFLPESLSEEEASKIGLDASIHYSKEKILRIFLRHDWAEAWTGDLTPKQRNELSRETERRVNSYIDLFHTYKDYQYISHFNSWREFEDASSINGKIAKEIDALDNLLQLYLEIEQPGVEISDFEFWKEYLIQRIETPMCKRILNLILDIN